MKAYSPIHSDSARRRAAACRVCARRSCRRPRGGGRCRPAPGDRRADAAGSAAAADDAPVRDRPTQPLSFTIDNPARISFDLPNTTLALPSRRIDVKAGGLDTILARRSEGPHAPGAEPRSADPLRHAPRRQQHRRDARRAESAVPLPVRAVARSNAAPSSPLRPPTVPRGIRSIDFRRGTDGAGRVVVKLTDPRTQINQRQVGNQIIVDFAGTELPKNLMRRFDATDFGTPVSAFDVVRTGQRHAHRHQRFGRLRPARLPVRTISTSSR